MAADGSTRAEEYRRLIERYATGDSSAPAILASWPGVDLAVVAAPAGSAAPRENWAGAVLALHTAALLLNVERGNEATALIDAGGALAGGPGPGEDFARSWHLAAGYLRQSFGSHDRAFQHYRSALQLHHDDPESLLARATALEYSVLPDGYGAVPVAADEVWSFMECDGRAPDGLAARLAHPERASTSLRWRLLELLVRQYRDVLARDGSLVEARLRLGRVQAAYGLQKEAAAGFRSVASEATDPFLVSIAHLCLARLSGEDAQAVAEYQAAIQTEPSLRPAWVGLSHALHGQGDREAALAALERAFVLEGDRSPNPWVEYHLGRGRAFPRALAALRAVITADR